MDWNRFFAVEEISVATHILWKQINASITEKPVNNLALAHIEFSFVCIYHWLNHRISYDILEFDWLDIPIKDTQQAFDKQKSVWSNVLPYVKIYIFWKFTQYTIYI